MTTFPGSPRLLRGGLVLVDPVSGAVERVIALQYNPETLSRTLASKATGGQEGDRSEALRITGPPVETFTVEAQLDATDALEKGDSETAELGVHREIALLETLLYPSASALASNHALAAAGTLEIVPMETPLLLFVWGETRVLPVRLTSFTVAEEAYDPNLNPIRAKVSLGMRVLSVDDLGFEHKGGSLFMVHHRRKEQLAARAGAAALGALGLSGLP